MFFSPSHQLMHRVSQLLSRGRRKTHRRTRRGSPRVEVLEGRLLPDAVTWVGGSGNWADGSHWTPHPPQADDNVTIGTPAITVTHSSGYDSIKSLTSNANLVISGGSSVEMTGGLTANADVNLGDAAGTTAGQLSFRGGSQSVSGMGSMLLGAGSLVMTPGTALTLGLPVRGKSGFIGGTSGNNTIVNRTTISADAGGTIYLGGSWTNEGTILAQNGGSVNLEGSFTTARLGTVTTSGGTGTINLTGTLVNTGATFQLTAATGSWNLKDNGTIIGGTLNASEGAVLRALSGTLSGVTVNGGLDLSSGEVTVTGGLTVNAALGLGNTAGTTYGRLSFQGSQTVDGTGSVLLGGSGSNGLVMTPGTTLTLGPNLTIHGKSGIVGGGPSSNNNIVNQGTISADVGGSLYGLYLGSNWTNTGTIRAQNGGTINLEGNFATARLGTVTTSGGTGTINLDGTLANTGATLQLTAATGSWNLQGGTIVGGTLNASGGAALRALSGTLSGVTVNGGLDLSNGVVTVTDGLTVNAAVGLGNAAGITYGQLSFRGSQTVGGTGSLLLGGSGSNGLVTTPGTTLTLSPGLTVHGKNGVVDSSILVNQGTISADAGGTIYLRNNSITNTGGIQALYGGTVNAGRLTVDGSGFLASRSPSTITVSGNLVGATVNSDQFAPLGKLVLNGSGTPTAPQLLEVMSQDVGNVSAGFARKFVYGTLALDNYTYVRLVDNARNSRGMDPEALYVNTLTVPAGTTLDLNGLHAYARDIQTGGSIVGGTVLQLPPGGPLPLASPAPAAIISDSQSDEWTFFGRAGQATTVVVNTGSSGIPQPSQPYLNFANVQLLDPSGNVLASSTNSQSGADVTLLEVALPVDGTYRVRVRAGQTGGRGHYVLTLWDATVHTAPANVNQAVTSRIDSPYRIERWNFTAGAGDLIRLDLLNSSTPALHFDLTGPNGYVGFSGLSGSSDVLTLPTTGNYVLKAYSTEGRTGSSVFRLRQTTQIDLTLGTAYSGTLAGSGQAQLFRVTLPSAQQLQVDLRDSASADHNELYVQFGAPPTRADYQYRFSSAASANQRVLVPMAAPGSWYILVYGEAVPSPSNYTLMATGSPIVLSGLTPDHASNSADMVLTLTGAGFDPTTTVILVAGDGTQYPAATVSVDLPTQITATFRAGAVPVGTYAVRATRSDGSSAQLANAFQVTAGGQAVLRTNVVVPTSVGYHQPATIYVEYSNTGTIDMPAPLLVLTPTQNGRAGAFLTLNQTRFAQGVWTSAVPDGFAHTAQILASGATPGVLHPGESGRIPVYYAGWQLPWDFSYPPIYFNLSVLKTDNATPIDWSSLKDGLRPDNMSADAWNGVFASLVAQMGMTWGSYVARLDSDASYLSRLGEKVSDVSQLWAFEVLQANGLTPLAQLASGLDADVPAPGLRVSFSRVFSPSLTGRYQVGPLGRGWFTFWQTALSVKPDGTVLITGQAGTQRRFQPDRRGGYLAMTGDQGTLTAVGGGAFTLRELDGRVTGFRGDGSLDYLQDTNGNRITAGYTGGRLTSLAHSSGQALQIAYNAAGLIATVTDPVGRVTRYSYDDANQHLLTVLEFNGRLTQYTYAADHALLSVTYPAGTHDFFSYDGQGHLIDIHHDGGAQPITFAYGPAGTVTATDAASGTTKYFFDPQGQPAKVQDPLGHTVYLSYDDHFNLVQATDSAGQNYTYGYDAKGHLVRSTGSLGQVTAASHAGPFNRLASVTDANGNTTQYGYDGKGNLQYTTYADGTMESLAYDPVGDVIRATNRRGHPINYGYDTSGRLLSKTFADSSQVTYGYDPRGNLTSTRDAGGTTTLTYDPNDRLTQITYPSGRFLRYTYDPAGRRTQMVDQSGFTVNYAYDAVGRLAGLTSDTGANIVTYTYDAAGRLSRKDLGNGTRTTYEYDLAGQVRNVINYAPGGAVNSRFDYTYDNLGRRVTMATLDGTWTYSYDGTGELTHAVFASVNPDIPNQDLAYTYDAAGNRIRTVINGVITQYVANNLNQYTSAGTVSYTYDADGNLVTRRDTTGTSTYTYNDENRLVGVATPDGSTWTYQYDPFGDRVTVIRNGQRTDYVIDPSGLGNVVGEYNGAGGLVAHYTQGLGLTSRVDASNAAAYYDFDALGSTVGLTGSAGSYVNRYSYLPFGERLSSTQAIANPFAYVGQFGVMQEDNGLHFMRARYYSPVDGRFLSKDPLGLAGGQVNLYAYVAQNPVSRKDPNGLDECLSRRQNGALNVVKGSLAFCALVGKFAGVLGAILAVFCGLAAAETQIFQGVSDLTCDDSPPAPDGPSQESGHPDLPGPDGGEPPDMHIPDPPSSPPPPPFQPCNPCMGCCPGSQPAGSVDPNDKIGPGGFGPANFMALNRAFPYRIDFENDATATAPAQRVDITDQLSANLDWTTFQLTEIGFGDVLLTIPAGTQHYQTTVPMTYNGRTFQVEIEAGLRSQTGQIFATFQSIDPATSLPPDVLTGFLPPENGTGRGQGHISYTIRPRSGLTTGTQIRNIAQVTFDFGETIATNQRSPHDPSQGTDPAKEALVTIDAVPPTSSVNPLPATSPPSFLVTWAGTDDAGGSGIAVFDIYVSDNDGPFVAWLTGTPRTVAAFRGVFGHRYAFYSIATDHAGNREAVPAAAQATTVANLPAIATHFRVIPSVNPVVAGMPFTITVTVLDAGNSVVPGYTGTVHLSSSDGLAGLPVDYPFTVEDNGMHTFSVTLSTTGNQTITVTDTLTAAITGQAATTTELGIPTADSGPNGIVLGPDGNLWFVETAANKIGRINPDGTISEFPVPSANSRPKAITMIPGSNLWFTEFDANRIGRIAPDGTITEFPLPTAGSGPMGITLGPDGNVWFTEFNGNRIGRITPDGTVTEFPIPTAGSGPHGITLGPGGKLWFTEFNGNQIGRIAPDGSITEFPIPTVNSGPEGITVGPDGNLWFTEFNGNRIGRITPDGSTITEFPIATLDSGPQGITAGPDGNLWFTETNGNQIGRITPDGRTLTEFLVPTDGSVPAGLAFDLNGNLWFTESQAGQIGQLVPVILVNSSGGSGGGGAGGGADDGFFPRSGPGEATDGTVVLTDSGLRTLEETWAARILAIYGDYPQTGTGSFNQKLAAFDHREYDPFQTTSAATLDGTLNIARLDSFFAREGAAYQVLKVGSRSRDYATRSLSNLSDAPFSDPCCDDLAVMLMTFKN
jgi:RHS repeat-associated protein